MPKRLEILKTFSSRPYLWSRPTARLTFLTSKRLKTKTLVLRTTSLVVC